MQRPPVPDMPAHVPASPEEEQPTRPRPEMPGVDPSRDQPGTRPAHPDDPEGGDGQTPVAPPEALDVRIP
ncbi:hypothetical protein KPL74_07690 [Bacillus sp. NP157]|nr:hypothetical protein KPL74_07690 [Bacillus sp. NP157]